MCSPVPLRKAAYVWYRTMTAILLRRERGLNNAEMYAVLVVTPSPPLQREVTFQKGGRNDARVRYLQQVDMQSAGQYIMCDSVLVECILVVIACCHLLYIV